jgi:hypothetical protein
MTKISIYPTISSPQGDDILIGTDIHSLDTTKNFKIEDMFAIGLETNVSKLNIYDPSNFEYSSIVSNDGGISLIDFEQNSLFRSEINSVSIYGTDYKGVIRISLTTDRVYDLPDASGTLALQTAASGSFVSQDGKTVTVVNGIITSIV